MVSGHGLKSPNKSLLSLAKGPGKEHISKMENHETKTNVLKSATTEKSVSSPPPTPARTQWGA